MPATARVTDSEQSTATREADYSVRNSTISPISDHSTQYAGTNKLEPHRSPYKESSVYADAPLSTTIKDEGQFMENVDPSLPQDSPNSPCIEGKKDHKLGQVKEISSSESDRFIISGAHVSPGASADNIDAQIDEDTAAQHLNEKDNRKQSSNAKGRNEPKQCSLT